MVVVKLLLLGDASESLCSITYLSVHCYDMLKKIIGWEFVFVGGGALH